jgi:hypothetical protein
VVTCYYDLNLDPDTIGDYGQGDNIATTYCSYAKVRQEKFSFLYNTATAMPERTVFGVYEPGPDNPIEEGEVLVFQDSSYVHFQVNHVYQPGEQQSWIIHTGAFKGEEFIPAWQDCHLAPLVGTGPVK